ncbi:MAG: twin-arginine translocase TatA/TatE family subunit [Phycisphaerae bacterium]|nr:twin-arginine translocase TatA/TatE family subunit [Phycisphaerae bacterium]
MTQFLAELPVATAPTLAIFGLPQGSEIILILFVGLILFGRRLPEVGRSLGQGIVEFKKGLKGVTEEVDRAGDERDNRRPAAQQQIPDHSAPDAARRVETQVKSDVQ